MDEFEVHGLMIYYSYKEKSIDKTHKEFGWVIVESIPANEAFVQAQSALDPTWDNCTTLRDYATYFERMTSLTAKEFIKKWDRSPGDLKLFWKAQRPHAPEDQHEFILSLARLISERIPFTRDGKTYQVMENKL